MYHDKWINIHTQIKNADKYGGITSNVRKYDRHFRLAIDYDGIISHFEKSPTNACTEFVATARLTNTDTRKSNYNCTYQIKRVANLKKSIFHVVNVAKCWFVIPIPHHASASTTRVLSASTRAVVSICLRVVGSCESWSVERTDNRELFAENNRGWRLLVLVAIAIRGIMTRRQMERHAPLPVRSSLAGWITRRDDLV